MAAVSLDDPSFLAFQARPRLFWCSVNGGRWLAVQLLFSSCPLRRESIIRPLVYEKLGWTSWDDVVEAPFWRYKGPSDRS